MILICVCEVNDQQEQRFANGRKAEAKANTPNNKKGKQNPSQVGTQERKHF